MILRMNDWKEKSDYRSKNFSGNWSRHFINEYVESLFSIDFVETQNKFSTYKNEHLPTSLYKFYSPNIYSLINLQNQSIYLSSPRNFNDPFDSYVCVETETFIKLYLLKVLKQKGYVSAKKKKTILRKRNIGIFIILCQKKIQN